MPGLVDGLMRAAEMAREMCDVLHGTAAKAMSRGDWNDAHVASMVAQAYTGFAARLEEEAEKEVTGTYQWDGEKWVTT